MLLDRLLAAFEKFFTFAPLKHNMVHAVSNLDPDSDCSEQVALLLVDWKVCQK